MFRVVKQQATKSSTLQRRGWCGVARMKADDDCFALALGRAQAGRHHACRASLRADQRKWLPPGDELRRAQAGSGLW